MSKRELILRINNQLLLLESQRIIERQNERIQSVSRSKDKLYSVIAHDLRAPDRYCLKILEALDHQKEKIPDDNIKNLIKMLQETTVRLSCCWKTCCYGAIAGMDYYSRTGRHFLSRRRRKK